MLAEVGADGKSQAKKYRCVPNSVPKGERVSIHGSLLGASHGVNAPSFGPPGASTNAGKLGVAQLSELGQGDVGIGVGRIAVGGIGISVGGTNGRNNESPV